MRVTEQEHRLMFHVIICNNIGSYVCLSMVEASRWFLHTHEMGTAYTRGRWVFRK